MAILIFYIAFSLLCLVAFLYPQMISHEGDDNMDKYLSDDELLYAVKHDLPLFGNQYNELERAALKEKAAQEHMNQLKKIEERKRKILFR